MINRGWSVNLSVDSDPDIVEFPVPPIFVSSEGPVMEVVFWSRNTDRWVHGVASHFERRMPAGHVQVTIGDLEWIRQVVGRSGDLGLLECVEDLERSMLPDEG